MEDIVISNHSDEPFRIKEEIKDIRQNLSLSSIRLAYLLHKVKNEKIFLQWDYPSFEAAISDPEISISRSTAYGLVQVWETWVEKYKLSPEKVAEVPYDKLLLISSVVNDDNHQELFDKASALSRQDLEHVKLEIKNNSPMPEFKPMPKVWRCKGCGRWNWDAKQEDTCIC